MEDLISRQAAIDVIDKIFPVDPMRNEFTQGITFGAALAKEWIKSMPSAEPKKGEWEAIDVYEVVVACSECKQKFTYQHNYCPNCGAKMEVSEWDTTKHSRSTALTK